jgi:hypothetical protein
MKRILFIGHDATRSGAPFVLLHLLRWLRKNAPDLEFELLLLSGGELEREFRQLCTVHALRNDARTIAARGTRKLRRILGGERRLLARLAADHP